MRPRLAEAGPHETGKVARFGGRLSAGSLLRTAERGTPCHGACQQDIEATDQQVRDHRSRAGQRPSRETRNPGQAVGGGYLMDSKSMPPLIVATWPPSGRLPCGKWIRKIAPIRRKANAAPMAKLIVSSAGACERAPGPVTCPPIRRLGFVASGISTRDGGLHPRAAGPAHSPSFRPRRSKEHS